MYRFKVQRTYTVPAYSSMILGTLGTYCIPKCIYDLKTIAILFFNGFSKDPMFLNGYLCLSMWLPYDLNNIIGICVSKGWVFKKVRCRLALVTYLPILKSEIKGQDCEMYMSVWLFQ